jgi:hypothetical protein
MVVEGVARVGLDTVELLMAIEDEFGITVPNDVAPLLVRLSDLHAFAIRALAERGEAVDADRVWERLKRVVVKECGVREVQVVPEAHLNYDLGLD